MRFAFFDENGRVQTAHNDDTVGVLPDGAIELSGEQWDVRFDLRYVGGALINDPFTSSSADIKDRKWLEIKAERDRRRSGGFRVGAYWFHSDSDSKTQHLANKDTARDQQAAGGNLADNLLDPLTGDSIPWKTMSGEFVVLSCQLAIDIVAAAKAAEFATFRAAEAHKVAMLAMPDPSAYDFSAGWPETYADAEG